MQHMRVEINWLTVNVEPCCVLLTPSSVVDLAYVKASVFDRNVTDVDVTHHIAVNGHVLTNQKPKSSSNKLDNVFRETMHEDEE